MYSTLDDLKKIIPAETLLDLTDDADDGEFDAETPNVAYQNVVNAIEAADAVIDSYLGGRYNLPLSSTPKIITIISAHLAVCNLFDRKHEHKLPDGLADRRKNQIKMLEAFQSGAAVIPEQPRAEPSEILVNKTRDDQLFTDEMLGMM